MECLRTAYNTVYGEVYWVLECLRTAYHTVYGEVYRVLECPQLHYSVLLDTEDTAGGGAERNDNEMLSAQEHSDCTLLSCGHLIRLDSIVLGVHYQAVVCGVYCGV